MSKVIVVSAHPDDEVLGCGGTLLKHKEQGDEIGWLISTKIPDNQGFSKDTIIKRQKEIQQITDLFEFVNVWELAYDSMSLTDETLIEMIPRIGTIFKAFQPEIIYVLNRSDAHSDHLITFKAVIACTKSFRHPYIKKVLMYETISETEFGAALPENVFMPNYFVDISAHLDGKLTAMEIYESELGEHPFPRSLENIKALAHLRGASVGVPYAEAYQLLKYIDK